MVIEKGIPIPKGTKGREMAEMARNMEINDSVLCDTEQRACTLRYALKREGCKATIRKLREGWRVWRVS